MLCRVCRPMIALFTRQEGHVVIQAPQAPRKTTTKKTKQSQIEKILATVL